MKEGRTIEWLGFAKRLGVILVVFVMAAVILSFIGGWNTWNLFLLLFIEGAILLTFGACLGTSLIEGATFGRYGANPPVVRDTRRHLASRRREQERSGTVLLVAGAILLIAGITGLSLLYLLP